MKPKQEFMGSEFPERGMGHAQELHDPDFGPPLVVEGNRFEDKPRLHIIPSTYRGLPVHPEPKGFLNSVKGTLIDDDTSPPEMQTEPEKIGMGLGWLFTSLGLAIAIVAVLYLASLIPVVR
jgi:hypothetical protein